MIQKISPVEQAKVLEAAKLRFKDASKFRCPEAVILFEQGVYDIEEIFDYCSDVYSKYNITIEKVHRVYVSREYVDAFANSSFLPLFVDNIKREIHVANIPEHANRNIPPLHSNYAVIAHFCDIVWYIEHMSTLYGQPQFLNDLPIYDVLGFIVEEAIRCKVIDTTISSGEKGGQVYHNVNLDTVTSKRRLGNHQVTELIRLLASLARDSLDLTNRNSRRFAVQLNEHYRARIEVTPNIYGFMATLRLLPNSYFSYKLTDINLDEKTIEFIRIYCQNLSRPGARIVAGPTGSGKNTSIFSSLTEILTRARKIKAVSLEQPVELLLEGLEQIEANTDELMSNYSQSMIRHNPDLIYFSEVTDRTAMDFMKIANTGKVIYSTIHTNSAATVVSRLIDLTGLSIDRVIQDLNCVIYQNLIRDEEYGVRPVNTCIYFSEALRKKCIGKSLGDVMLYLYEAEDRWRVMSPQQIRDGALEM